MTIKTRIGGAFAIVLVLLLALGANALWAISGVNREAAEVDFEIARMNVLIEVTVQIRATVVRAAIYSMSETAADAEQLRTAVATLTATSQELDASVAEAWAGGLQQFHREAAAYLGQVASISAIVEARQKNASKAGEDLTDLEVLTAAIAERALPFPEAATTAVRLLAAMEASGVSTFRYRSSRNPADIATAKRWLSLAKEAFVLLQASPPTDR